MKRSLSRALIMFIKTYGSHRSEKKLVAKREFNNPMNKHAMKALKGDETVSHLPRKFSRIARGGYRGGWIGWISTPHFSVKKNSKCHFI